MNRRKLRRLVDEVARDLDLPPDATHRDASRRVCELMSERLERPVDVRFAAITNAVCLSGATALLENGTYLVICADSPSWYHRLHVLLRRRNIAPAGRVGDVEIAGREMESRKHDDRGQPDREARVHWTS